MLSRITLWVAGLAILGVLHQADAQPINVRVSSEAPINHFSDLAIKSWAKRVEELTKGGVKVQIFPAGQLYTDREAVRAISRGDLDMNVSITAWMTQIEPKLIVLDMPYMFGSMDEFVSFWESTAGRDLLTGLEKRNVRALAIWPTGNIVIATRRPVRKLEDFSNLKIRVFGGRAQELTVRALGGQGATIAAPEVAAAIETGVVDGTNGAQAYWANNFPAKLPFVTQSNMWRNGFGVWANAKFWNGLPQNVRTVMEEAMREATLYERKLVAEQEENATKKAVAGGAEVIVLSPQEEARWRAATASIPGQYPDIADLIGQIRASGKK